MRHQALLIGLPGSGKTTFVAALWHVISSHEVDGSLALEVLDASVEHLHDLSHRWHSFEETLRTSSNAEHISAIKIKSGPAGSATAEIIVPDLAGESIQQSLADRRWTTGFWEFVRDSTGVLLFIHPEEIRPHWPIRDAMDVAGVETPPSPGAGTVDGSAEIEWSPGELPTQVELVDLLQLLCDHMPGEQFRLAVIVSAWDLVQDQGSPAQWLARELPLVEQFLVSARSRLDLRVYGVSAQGGKLPEEGDRLKLHIKASDRIQVVLDDAAPSHDITAPLRWVVDVDAA